MPGYGQINAVVGEHCADRVSLCPADGCGGGIVGLRAQPSTSGTPTAIGSVQPQTTPDSSQKSMIDTATLVSIQAIQDRLERRLSEERQSIVHVLELVAKVIGASIAVIIAIVAYFGYQTYSSIEKQINKGVEDKINEKSNEFSRRLEQQIKGLEDQAAVASYNIQFLAPRIYGFGTETTIILPTHIQRFVEILADENADSKLLAQIHVLLSDKSHDNDSPLVNRTLVEMASCTGRFSWISRDAKRLSNIIDLLRDRNVEADPASVRVFVENKATPPGVRKSAILYAERVRDKDAVEYLANILSDKSRLRDADETIFALVSLDPTHAWVTEWMTNLRQQPRDQGKLAQIARVAGLLMQSVGRRYRDVPHHEAEQAVDFAAAAASLIIDNGGRFVIEKWWAGEYQVKIKFAGQCHPPWIKGDLFLAAGSEVVNKLCRELIGKQDIVGMTNFVKKTTPEFHSHDDYYFLEARLGQSADIRVDVGGAPCTIEGRTAQFHIRSPQGQDVLVASWQTDEGVTKFGVVKSIGAPQDARFSFNVTRMSEISI
jgi:hypothetical protein